MRNTIFNLILICLGTFTIGISCSNHDASKQESAEESIESQELEHEPYVNYDSIWLEEFVAFRDAVYQQDLKAIKGFVDFPMEAGEIWYLAYPEGSSKLKNAEANNDSFSEQHFDKTFKKIFSPQFTKSLMKVKSKQLFDLGEYVTSHFEEGDSGYHIHSIYQREGQFLSLSLLIRTLVILDEDTGEHFRAESSVVYHFKLVNGKMRFMGIMMAG